MAASRILGLLMCMAVLGSNAPAVHSNEPARENTITVGIEAAPTSILPMVVTGSQSGQISAQVFAGLCRLTPKGELVPYLARSFCYTPDYKTIKIRLRTNATFHDGVPITARDVEFSIRTAQKIHAFHTVFEQLREIRLDSPHELTLTFKAPQPHFMKMMLSSLVPILPRHIYGSVKGVMSRTMESTLVGSGPFRPVSYSEKTIKLEKYPGFFLKGRPFLDGITFIFYDKVGEIYYGFVEQEIDVSAFNWRYDRAGLVKTAPYLAHTTAGYGNIKPYFLIQFNLATPPFDRLLVRKALSLAIDRKFLGANGFSRPIDPMYGPMVQIDPFYTPPSYDHVHNVREANRLMDQAGFPRNAAGVRMQIVTESAPYVSQTSAILTFLQYELSRTIGVELIISTPKSSGEWEKKIGSGKYSSTIDELFSWHDPVIGFHRLYASSNRGREKVWSNTTGFSDPDIDRLLTRAAMEADTVKRKALYAKIQNGIGSRYISLWLTGTPYSTIYNTRVHGLDDLFLSTMSPMDTIHVTGHAPAPLRKSP